MEQFFSDRWTGPAFVMFGLPHLGALLAIILLNMGLLPFKSATEKTRLRLRWTMALILWANGIAFYIWVFLNGHWDVRTMLPLHLCSALMIVGGLPLVMRSVRIYEYMYFMGISGGLQALLTPILGMYGFPHFLFWQFFIGHGLIVTIPIYMTVVEGFRPTWKSMRRVFIGMNIYMALIFVFNLWLGSNYLFIARKPSTPSLLDALPPWPWYIAFFPAIGIVMFILLYVPFIIKDWKAKRAEAV